MYKKTIIFVVLITAMTIWGCATLEQLIDKPDVEFKSVSLHQISLFEATPVFKFKLTNPNPMGINLDKIAYNLKVNNQKFIKGVSDQHVRIKAASSGMFELPVTFNYMDVFETASDFINNDKVTYNLSGFIGIGPFSVPYQAKGEFDVPSIPEISLQDVRISNISMINASVIFDFEFKNNNSFDINLDALEYALKLDGKEFIKGAVGNITPIKKGMSRIEIPMNLNFLQMGTSLYKILKDSSARYELFGNMKFNLPISGNKSFPFQKAGRISFHK